MKKMYQVNKPKKENNKIVIKRDSLHLRNELHFQACLANNTYIEKNKKKIIPRKMKYKEKFF